MTDLYPVGEPINPEAWLGYYNVVDDLVDNRQNRA